MAIIGEHLLRAGCRTPGPHLTPLPLFNTNRNDTQKNGVTQAIARDLAGKLRARSDLRKGPTSRASGY